MKNKLVWCEVTLLIAPFVLLALLRNQIPARVPIHWNWRGEIDGWSSKPAGLLVMPLIGLFTVALLHLISWLDPKLRRNQGTIGRMNKVLPLLRLAFAAFFAVLLCVQISAAFGYTIASARLLDSCLFALLAILGNYLPNLRPNYFLGIRTPWTLESPDTWRATHRLGGRLMFFGSLFLLLVQFFVSPSASNRLFVIFIVLLAGWSFLYSWHHFRTHGAQRDTI